MIDFNTGSGPGEVETGSASPRAMWGHMDTSVPSVRMCEAHTYLQHAASVVTKRRSHVRTLSINGGKRRPVSVVCCPFLQKKAAGKRGSGICDPTLRDVRPRLSLLWTGKAVQRM